MRMVLKSRYHRLFNTIARMTLLQNEEVLLETNKILNQCKEESSLKLIKPATPM